MNDNNKITHILYKLLVIYSRSLKRIKLKYFLRYYKNVILNNYLKYKKLNNMFKKKAIIYKKSSSNNKKYNYDPLIGSTTNSYSYLLNKSEPIIVTPQLNRNMAYLMTPCYLVNNDEINNRNIRKYNKKFNNSLIKGYNYLFPETQTNSYKTFNSGFPFEPNYFDKKSSKTKMKNNSEIRGVSASPRDNYNNLFNNYLKSIEKQGYKYIKYPINSYKNSLNKNKTKNLYNEQLFHKFGTNINKSILDKNNESKSNSQMFHINDNDFTLGDANNRGKLIKKSVSTNKPDKKNKYNKLNYKTNYLEPDINRGILDHLYENNFLNKNIIKKKGNPINSSKKIKNNTNDKINRNSKSKNNIPFNKKKNVIGVSSEKKPNLKYSIFKNDNNKTNKSNLIFPNSRNNIPYNKIFNQEMISFSISSGTNSGKNTIPLEQIAKKRNSSNTINNNSISNSQTNNPVANRSSTNYSIVKGRNSYFSSNKDLQKGINNSINQNNNNYSKNEKNIKVISPYEISSGIVDEFFRDSIGRSSNNSKSRISLQSLSDSKMVELAGHYKLADDSSSDNYRMDNIIHSKKEYNRKSERILKNDNKKK